MNFTPEQEKVIKTRGKNILVSAAAGSGKTAVLVERIISRVTDDENPVDIDRILTVTFTNAAAAEMRDRIRKRLSDASALHPDDQHIRQQLNLIHNANIMTIDSFCVRVLRENFEEAGIDPSFRVGDENETGMLSEDACDEVLNEAYEEGSEDFYSFLDMCSPGKEDRNVAELIMKLSKASDSRVDPEEWLGSLAEPYKAGSMEDSEVSGHILALSDTVLQNVLYQYDAIIDISSEADGPGLYIPLLSDERDRLQDILDERSFEGRFNAFSALDFKSLPSKKDSSADPEKREKVKNFRNKLKDTLKKLRDDLFSKDPERAVREMNAAYPAVKELVRLTLKYRERFTEKKGDRNVLDFSDIEHLALKVLKSPAGDGYRDFFSEVMTDEYQDSNSIQEAILTSVAVHDNYFTVGDVKQSIYSFRLAEPGIFMKRYKAYEKDKKSELILLNKNFRSRKSVLDPVNALFRLIMHEETGGVEYDKAQELYYGEGYDEDGEDKKAELCFIEKDEENELDNLELEAAFIASKIEKIVGSFTVTDKKDGDTVKRSAEYRDICILMRSVSGNDEVVRDVLLSRGIPAVIEGKNGYFKTREIRDVLNYLTVLDNPRQDIALIALMKSPFGGFNDEELSVIRASYKEGLFIDAIENGEYESPLKEKVSLFMGKIAGFRALLPYTPIHELIRLIIRDDYSLYVSSIDGRGAENLELLIRRAADFESMNYRGLFSFLRYIERMKKYDLDFSEAASGDSYNAVRILSIHKSKGLEFPVVFLMNINKRFNQMDAADDVICHRETGLGISYVDPDRRVKIKTILREAAARKQKSENIGEELRILYVALTRAKEKLILSGVIKDSGKLYDKPCSVDSANSYLDFIIAAVQSDISGWIADNYSISIINGESLTLERMEKGASLMEKKEYVLSAAAGDQEELRENILKNTGWTYPNEVSVTTPSKVSVSELKIRAMEDEEFVNVAEARDITALLSEEDRESMEERQKNMKAAAEAGTAFHKVMSLIPEDQSGEKEAVEGFLSGLLESGSLLPEERDMIKPGDIAAFLRSDLNRRMNAALKRKDLFREQPFIIGRPASEIFPEASGKETVQIQGIIDAFFIEDGGITVMDYKTDHVQDADTLIKRYRKQLDLYAGALTQLLDMPVKEKIIYSVRLKKEISV
ncbi:MAG: helicase-exonuclease AddAB subunit AddA [Lachnospiraceae bacterium]|nr:helicase-exonuclease AddAB subunit AddA [Lachnospiraceae bacterium]